MTCSPQHLTQQIREKGFRITPQRIAILNALHASGGHLSPTDIYAQVRDSAPGLTEPTVYRTLDFLYKHSLVYATQTNGRVEYEIANHDHHHLRCRVCGGQVEIGPDELTQLYQHLEQSTGYRLATSHLTFVGVCPACQSGALAHEK